MIKLLVLYDGDAKPTWVDAKTLDVEILAEYAEEKKIRLTSKPWKWLHKRIETARKNWFARVQEQLCNVKYLSECNRFIEQLHKSFKQRSDINDEDSIAFGQAYKKALDIGKHGVRVPLPPALRREIKAKSFAFDKFIKNA